MPNPKDIVELLRGLPQEVVDKIYANVQAEAQKAKDRIERQQRLDAQKARITEAITPIATDLGIDFDVKVRGGKVDVALVGVGGGKISAPTKTPIRDSGMSSRELVERYLPERLDEFDANTDRNFRYGLAMQALAKKHELEGKPAAES